MRITMEDVEKAKKEVEKHIGKPYISFDKGIYYVKEDE